MASSIVFYDIPSTLPINAWSPNTWKTRYALNFKGLSYRTEWIEYPDIEALCKKIGAPHTRNKPDGRPHYTLPVIHDLSTGSDLLLTSISLTHPSRRNCRRDAALALTPAIGLFVIPSVPRILNPASLEYFHITRGALFGKKLDEVIPTGDAYGPAWQKLKDSFGKIDSWIRANGEESTYIMGDTICYADLFIAAYVLWFKLVLPEKWDEAKTWHEGRWEKLLENTAKYEAVL
ncbi:hypothetical protein C8F04DRAFT_1171671 [Mycena alexandri]|uniref:Glutathione S-transferase UstS-like C-terminal domain-containing protein n=1 Tax=Mycena alexandri TaxID=1745969 RepID=A0AAD6RV69_9AGAR|nr:hypothetical protein C8F04DRAFT_1171671 [Mycena alexandri]